MKLPAFQFYPGDWLKDPQLAMASPAVRGIWIDFIAVSFEAPVRGVLEGTAVEFARLLRCSTDEFMEFVGEAQRLGFADVTPTSSVTVTQMSRVVFRVECRRMTRDEKQRQDWGLRKRRERERKAGHADVTPMSQLSSSSSSSSKNNTCTKTEGLARVNPGEKKARQGYPPDFEEIWSTFPNRAGGNSKRKAFKAYQARLRDEPPATPTELLAGVKRYAAYADASGIVGTKHVQMAATFLGPDEHWRETWDPPGPTATAAHSVMTVPRWRKYGVQ